MSALSAYPPLPPAPILKENLEELVYKQTQFNKSLLTSLDSILRKILVELKPDVIGDIYPVGALYISTDSTNPGTLFGFGTWTAFGAGKVLVGLNSTDADFDTVEETGGEKTHTLTEAEMPAHYHSYNDACNVGEINNVAAGSAQGKISDTNTKGSGSAHNNLQPYIVVYMWKRTA